MTFDIFANRQDKPKFEAFCRHQQSSHWNPSSNRDSNRNSKRDAVQKMLLTPQPLKVASVPLYKFPMTGEKQSEWKQYGNFENEAPHASFSNRVKKQLKDEINDINGFVIQERLGLGSNFSTMQGKKKWNPASIEVNERSFEEGARFFKTSRQNKQFGVAYHPTPGDKTTHKFNSQVLKEIDWIKERKKERSLHGSDSLQDINDPRIMEITRRRQSSVMVSPSNRQSSVRQLHPFQDGRNLSSIVSEATIMAKKDEEIKKIFQVKGTIGERGLKRFEKSDVGAMMYGSSQTHHGRLLKLSEKNRPTCSIIYSPQGFPRRARFNQDLDKTIKESEKSIKKKLRLQSGSPRIDGSIASSRCTQASTLSKAQLQSYFDDKQKQIDEDNKSRISSINQGQRFGNKKSRLQSAIKIAEAIDEISIHSPQLSQRSNNVAQLTPRSGAAIKVEDEKAENEDEPKDHAFDEDASLTSADGEEDAKDATQEPEDEIEAGEEQLPADSESEKRAVEIMIDEIDNERNEREKMLQEVKEIADSYQRKMAQLSPQRNDQQQTQSQGQRNLMTSGINYASHPDSTFDRRLYNQV